MNFGCYLTFEIIFQVLKPEKLPRPLAKKLDWQIWEHLGYFWSNHQYFLVLWVPCSWENAFGCFSTKMVFRHSYIVYPKYDIGRKEFGKYPSHVHLRLSMLSCLILLWIFFWEENNDCTHWSKLTLIPFLIWRTFDHSRRWEMIKEF